jgi:nondiscriminating glutamyl-tRNA synthetase
MRQVDVRRSNPLDPLMKTRVRFAPSPTGFLHIGGARTALFNWLYARHTGGSFILRIEDTDATRNTVEAVEVIFSGLRWLGLDWDEGPQVGDADGPSRGDFGPYFQSRRGEHYRRRVDELRDKGLAYEREGAVRFRMTREPVTIPDRVAGPVVRRLTDREEQDPDFVIVRSDGQPVFHLVNVVDDLEMGITHVIRGEDHLSNTAKHLALFGAFGVEPPQYGHIPLILNGDGTKMSKRDQGASLLAYREEGYLAEAVVNYLCLLGWSPKDNREKLTLAEAIELFDLTQVLRANARFDLTKLQWLNGEFLRSLPETRFRALGAEALRRAGVDLTRWPPSYVDAALSTCVGKVRLLSELPAYAGFYFTDDIALDPAALAQDFVGENLVRIQRLRAAFCEVASFAAAELEETLKAVARECGVKAGVLVHPTRLACTGAKAGPSLYHLLEVLGRERVLARLDRALAAAAG